jgi:hypothetical protein
MSDPRLTDAEETTDTGTASEIPPRRKRGRPSSTPPGFDEFIATIDGNKSRRTHVEWFRYGKVHRVLGSGEEFAYLTGDAKTGEGARPEILAELGLLDNDPRICEFSRAICEHRPKTKAIAWRSVPGRAVE